MITDLQKRRLLEWAELLESGEFRQTAYALRMSNSYCCLGVACEKYRRDTGEGEWTTFDDSDHAETFLGCGAYLPISVARYFGLTPLSRDQGDLASIPEDTGNFQLELSAKNDNGLSFREIASMIREYVEENSNADD